MIHFENDYNEGMHPVLLDALVRTNAENLAGYGADVYTQFAKDKIRRACRCPQAEVEFLTGGTQTNQIVIASLLVPYEGVIAAETGHIAVHEAGAIEATGHKVLTLPHQEGKITAKAVADYVETFYEDANHEHMVFPGMVYLSQPTEYGTLYSQAEMQAIADVCHQYQMPLFVDGARLAYGLAAEENEIDLPTLAELADVFYIGGTKIGALAGEAVVFTKHNRPKHFTTIVKQHGALLAKGRLFGVTFDAFFTDGLYEAIGRQTLVLAKRVKAIIQDKGYPLYIDSPTNQQFFIVNNDALKAFPKELVYSFWEKCDDHHTIIRLVVSWSTTQEDVDRLREILPDNLK